MAKLSSTPAIVPTSDSSGGSSATLRGGGGAGLLTSGSATTAGGGRRDGENTGRSRVLDSVLSGMPHNGFALSGRGAGAGDGATLTDVTGSDGGGDDSTGPPRRVSSSIPASSASPDGPGTAAGAACTDTANSTMVAA